MVLLVMCLVASAHAGMVDRSMRDACDWIILLVMIPLAQVLLFVACNTIRTPYLKKFKHACIKLARTLSEYRYVRGVAAWILSTIVLCTYVWMIVSLLPMAGIILLLLFWVLYTIIVFVTRARTKFLTSPLAIRIYLEFAIYEIVAIVLYALLFSIESIQNIFSIVDPQGYDDIVFYIHPHGRVYIELLLCVFVSLYLTLIPYVLLLVFRFIKYLTGKIVSKISNLR